jgi:DNA-nicking Smr family endonuclease
MEQANKRAVHEILAPQHLISSDMIDLHGLHATEAVLATQQYIEAQIGKRKMVEVVTGAGHHSYKGPVLRPAILKLFQEKGWKFEKHAHNDGSFTVYLPSSH